MISQILTLFIPLDHIINNKKRKKTNNKHKHKPKNNNNNMAELNCDIPTRFPHETQVQYEDRQTKYHLILATTPDPDQAASLSMVYSNMVYLNARYPTAVEDKLKHIPEIARIVSEHRDDSAARITNVMNFARTAAAQVKK